MILDGPWRFQTPPIAIELQLCTSKAKNKDELSFHPS